MKWSKNGSVITGNRKGDLMERIETEEEIGVNDYTGVGRVNFFFLQ